MTQPTPNYPPVHPPAALPVPAQAYAPAPGYPPAQQPTAAFAPPPAFAPAVAAAPPPMAIAPSFDEVLALVPKGGFDGTEAYDGSEFRLAKACIVQTSTQQQELQVQVGQFALAVGQGRPYLEAVVIAVAKSRWYGPDYDEAQRLKTAGQPVSAWCQSFNGSTPAVGVPHRQSEACKGCQRTYGKGCSESRHIGLLVEGQVLELSVRNMACRDVDSFVQAQKMSQRPLFVSKVRITLRAEKSSAGTYYYLPTIQVLGPASREEVAQAQDIGPALLGALTRKGGGDAPEEQGTEPQHQAPAGPGFAPPPGYTPPTPAGPPAAVVDAAGSPVAAQWDHPPAQATPPTGPQPPMAPPGVSPNSPVTPAQAQQTWAYIVALGYDGGQVAGALKTLFGAQSMEQLTQIQWADLMGRVTARQAL